MLRYELIQKEMVECSQTSKSKEQSIKIKIILNIAFILGTVALLLLLLHCCFTSTVNIYSHVGTVS